MEYSTQPVSSGTQYFTVDHLGSTRLITGTSADPAQFVRRRYDYLPFGEGLAVGVNGRSAKYLANNAGAFPAVPTDGEAIKFTGQYRDAESGLDYFLARFLASVEGRFLSPDLPLVDQSAGDPQSWNLYSYARNNPLVYTDDDGRKVIIRVNDGSPFKLDDSDYRIYRKRLRNPY